MKALTKKQLQEKGCIVFQHEGGAYCVSGPVIKKNPLFIVHAKTMITARKRATQYLITSNQIKVK